MPGHGRSLRFAILALKVSRHAKIRFSALIRCDPRDRIIIRCVLPRSAKQVRCAGSCSAALWSALLFQSQQPGPCRQMLSCAKGRPRPQESLINRFVSFYKFRTNSESRLLIRVHRVVFCRDGQKVWVYPREFLAGIVAGGRPPGRGKQDSRFSHPSQGSTDRLDSRSVSNSAI